MLEGIWGQLEGELGDAGDCNSFINVWILKEHNKFKSKKYSKCSRKRKKGKTGKKKM